MRTSNQDMRTELAALSGIPVQRVLKHLLYWNCSDECGSDTLYVGTGSTPRGSACGSAYDIHRWSMCGYLSESVCGSLSGSVCGSLSGSVCGSLSGSVCGSLSESVDRTRCVNPFSMRIWYLWTIFYYFVVLVLYISKYLITLERHC